MHERVRCYIKCIMFWAQSLYEFKLILPIHVTIRPERKNCQEPIERHAVAVPQVDQHFHCAIHTRFVLTLSGASFQKKRKQSARLGEERAIQATIVSDQDGVGLFFSNAGDHSERPERHGFLYLNPTTGTWHLQISEILRQCHWQVGQIMFCLWQSRTAKVLQMNKIEKA